MFAHHSEEFPRTLVPLWDWGCMVAKKQEELDPTQSHSQGRDARNAMVSRVSESRKQQVGFVRALFAAEAEAMPSKRWDSQ